MHAAAIAQRETGVPAIVHYATMDTLRIFEEERADISKLVMGHWGLEFPVDEAIRRGAVISFDQFGMNFPGIKGDDERIAEVLTMLGKGLWQPASPVAGCLLENSPEAMRRNRVRVFADGYTAALERKRREGRAIKNDNGR